VKSICFILSVVLFFLRFRYVLVVRRAESAASMLTSVFPDYVDIVEAVLSLWLHSYIPVSSKYLHTLLRLLLLSLRYVVSIFMHLHGQIVT